MSQFSSVAAKVQAAIRTRLSVVEGTSRTSAAVDMDAEKQRVNSYIADVLKDSHVLYAKLARLQGDFKGKEAEDLFDIAQKVLNLGDDLSKFAQAFREGEATMADSSFAYGDDGSGGGQAPPQQAPAPAEDEGGVEEKGGVPFGESPDEPEQAPAGDEEEK